MRVHCSSIDEGLAQIAPRRPATNGQLAANGHAQSDLFSNMTGRKTIAILQPVYLPWLGYFEQMAYVDQFLFLDDVQYTKHDWRNRNRIKTVSGPIWLTVPVRKHPQRTPINAIRIDYAQDWVKRHLRSIEVHYCTRPYFQPLFSEIAAVLLERPGRLVDLSTTLIAVLCSYLGIYVPTAFSSELPGRRAVQNGTSKPVHDRDQRLIDICHCFGADLLYNGKKAVQYLDVERLRGAGIEVVFQDYQHPV